jgi:type II secretion system protein J
MRRGHRIGFTLLEVLASVSMFAVIMAALLGAFHITMNMRENAYKRIEEGLPKHYVADIIKRDFASAAAPAGVLAGPFIGESEEVSSVRLDTVEFFSASGMIDQENPWSELQMVQYYLLEPENEGSGLDFTRAVTWNLLPLDEEDPDEQRLLAGVRSLTLEYYDGEVWEDTWDSTLQDSQAPSAVRMLIEFEPEGDVEDEEEDEEAVAPSPLEIVVAIESRAIISEDAGARASGADGGGEDTGGDAGDGGGGR